MPCNAGNVFRGYAIERIGRRVGALKRELAGTPPLGRPQLLARILVAEECLAKLRQDPQSPHRSVASVQEHDEAREARRLVLLH